MEQEINKERTSNRDSKVRAKILGTAVAAALASALSFALFITDDNSTVRIVGASFLQGVMTALAIYYARAYVKADKIIFDLVETSKHMRNVIELSDSQAEINKVAGQKGESGNPKEL